MMVRPRGTSAASGLEITAELIVIDRIAIGRGAARRGVARRGAARHGTARYLAYHAAHRLYADPPPYNTKKK